MLFPSAPKAKIGIRNKKIEKISKDAFLSLEAPPKRVTGFDTLIPLPQGEHHYMISPEKIFYEIEKTINY